MNKEKSDVLRAVGIVLVLIGHGCTWLTGCKWKLVCSAGAIGVSVFLFLSGFGLFESYKVKKINGLFWWKNRFIKVIIPFWIAMIFQSIVNQMLDVHIGRSNWLVSMFGYVNYGKPVIDGTMWYITFLLFWYIVFWVIFICKVPDWLKIFAIWFIAYLGNYFRIGLVYDWQFNYYSFVLGVTVSYFYKYIFLNRHIFKNVGVVAIVTLLMVSTGYWDKLMPDLYIWMLYTYAGLVAIVSPVILNEFRLPSLLHSEMKKIARLSYYIYLVEGMVLVKLSKFYISDNTPLNIFYFIVLSILFAYILEQIVIVLNASFILCTKKVCVVLRKN